MRIKTLIALLLWPLGVFMLYWVSKHFVALFSGDLTAGLRYLVALSLGLVPVYGAKINTALGSTASADLLAYSVLWLLLLLLVLPAQWLYRKWAAVRWTALVAVGLFTGAAIIVAWPMVKPFFSTGV